MWWKGYAKRVVEKGKWEAEKWDVAYGKRETARTFTIGRKRRDGISLAQQVHFHQADCE
jgi:hypothetical protein